MNVARICEGQQQQQHQHSKQTPTVGRARPGDEVLDVLVVLDDGGHGVALPAAAEGVGLGVVVRQPVLKVQGEHGRSPGETGPEVHQDSGS